MDPRCLWQRLGGSSQLPPHQQDVRQPQSGQYMLSRQLRVLRAHYNENVTVGFQRPANPPPLLAPQQVAPQPQLGQHMYSHVPQAYHENMRQAFPRAMASSPPARHQQFAQQLQRGQYSREPPPAYHQAVRQDFAHPTAPLRRPTHEQIARQLRPGQDPEELPPAYHQIVRHDSPQHPTASLPLSNHQQLAQQLQPAQYLRQPPLEHHQNVRVDFPPSYDVRQPHQFSHQALYQQPPLNSVRRSQQSSNHAFYQRPQHFGHTLATPPETQMGKYQRSLLPQLETQTGQPQRGMAKQPQTTPPAKRMRLNHPTDHPSLTSSNGHDYQSADPVRRSRQFPNEARQHNHSGTPTASPTPCCSLPAMQRNPTGGISPRNIGQAVRVRSPTTVVHQQPPAPANGASHIRSVEVGTPDTIRHRSPTPLTNARRPSTPSATTKRPTIPAPPRNLPPAPPPPRKPTPQPRSDDALLASQLQSFLSSSNTAAIAAPPAPPQPAPTLAQAAGWVLQGPLTDEQNGKALLKAEFARMRQYGPATGTLPDLRVAAEPEDIEEQRERWTNEWMREQGYGFASWSYVPASQMQG